MERINTYHIMIITDKWTLLWRPLKMVKKYLYKYARLFPLLFMFSYDNKFNSVLVIVSGTFSLSLRSFIMFYIVIEHNEFGV